MNDPTRLIDDGAGLGKALLAAASDEPSPPHLRRNIHTAVALGTVGAGVTAASSAAAAGKTTSVVASLGVTKWVAVVAVGAVVSVTAAPQVRSLVMGAPAARNVSTKVVAPRSAVPQQPSVPRIVDVPPPVVTAPPVVTPPPAVSTPAQSTAIAPKPSADDEDVAREVEELDTARAALAAGDVDETIEKLNRHDLAFARGRLRPESLAVRIQAYAAKHDVTKVRDLAAAFRAEYPGHPFVARLDTIVVSATP
jgi:hypothetical protein